MRKIVISIVALLLLTGCWDRLPLRNLKIVDIVGVDYDEKTSKYILNFVVTKLNSAGRGSGDPLSESTKLTGASLVEAVGQGALQDKGPFIGINTRLFLLTESFAAQKPVQDLAFLLDTPYTTINSSVVVLDDKDLTFFKQLNGSKKEITKELNNFVLTLESYGTISNMTMMQFLLSKKEPLNDFALPVLKYTNSRMELNGALLFRDSISTGMKLSNAQVRTLMLLIGNGNIKQKLRGYSSKFDYGRLPRTGHLENTEYAFFTKNIHSKFIIHPKLNDLPVIDIQVKLKIYATELGEEVNSLKTDFVNKMEKELSAYLSDEAKDTIKRLQESGSDILGIGKELKAFHPVVWKTLDWRKDYQRVLIQPKIDVQIMNTETE